MLFTQLIHRLGVSQDLEFQDVFSVDDSELLSFIPRPVLALILVFPSPEVFEKQKAVWEATEQDYKGYGEEDVMWYMQTINNACGLYAILHAISNGEAKAAVRMWLCHAKHSTPLSVSLHQ